MIIIRRRLLRALGSLPVAAAMPVPAVAAAAAYPARSVKLVVPWPPGGGTDVFARLVAEELGGLWGQPVVVENRAGASGNIGAAAVASAAPDGYTFMLATITLATTPSLYASMPFDPAKAFAPITLVASVPHVLAVNPSLPVDSVRDLIALAKSRPGKLNYASAGVGSPFHLAAELFKSQADVDITHIPYTGGGPAITDVIGGQVEMTFANLVAVMPYVKSGQLRALGITSKNRSRIYPELVPIAETVPGYDFASWFGFLMPSGGSQDIPARLNGDILKVLSERKVRQRLTNDGAEVIASSPGEFSRFLAAETEKWARVLHRAGIKAQ